MPEDRPTDVIPVPTRPTSPPRPAAVSAFSPRALAIGLACVAMTCALVCYAELVVAKIQIGFLQLPPVVIGMLVLLLGGQGLLRSLGARLRLRTHELFTIYVMMLLASMVSSRGLLEKLIPLLVIPNYDATRENRWVELFYASIPRWAVPFDPAGEPKQEVATRFYEGLRAGEPIPWELWIVPLLAWGLFTALIFWCFLCMAVLLRRQWVDNEKLSFPLVQLPLEMIRETGAGREEAGGSGVGTPTPAGGRPIGSAFLRNRLTWIGFAIPTFLFGFNGLHQWYPSVPEFPIDINLNAMLTSPPWNAIGYTHLFVSFAAIGFFYLLPTDLLLSLWLFFLLTRVQEAQAAALGYQLEAMPLYPCSLLVGYQVMGAYLVLVAAMFWAARPHLRAVVRMALWAPGSALRVGGRDTERGAKAPERIDADEVLSYPVAFWGLAAGVLLSAAWLTLLGISYWLALFELAILLFVVVLVMARSTSEAGMLMTETSFRPIDVYRMFGDLRGLGAGNVTGLAFLEALWMRDQRGLLLTGFLDSMKLADGVRVRRRSLLGVFALGLLVALLVAGTLHISLPYQLGASQMYSYVYRGNPLWAFSDAAATLTGSKQPLPSYAPVSFAAGAGVTALLVAARSHVMWFPLHPLGYALSGSWTLIVFWFPCLVAWLLKVVILRYGGMKGYVWARPLFLGLVLGEFTMAVLWTLPSLFYRTPTPAMPWP